MAVAGCGMKLSMGVRVRTIHAALACRAREWERPQGPSSSRAPVVWEKPRPKGTSPRLPSWFRGKEEKELGYISSLLSRTTAKCHFAVVYNLWLQRMTYRLFFVVTIIISAFFWLVCGLRSIKLYLMHGALHDPEQG